MVGLPRSGKSTWAIDQELPIVCPDAIRLALHGQRFAAVAEPFVWAIAYLMAKALMLSGNNTVIIDATNTTKKRREEWVYRFPECKIEVKEMNTSKEECIKRAKENGDQEIIPIIERMAEQYEAPDEFRPDS